MPTILKYVLVFVWGREKGRDGRRKGTQREFDCWHQIITHLEDFFLEILCKYSCACV